MTVGGPGRLSVAGATIGPMNPSDGLPAAQDELRGDAPDNPLALILGPAGRRGRESAAAHRWDSARADFERLGRDGWQDLGLTRSRLAHGADPAARGDFDGETALHRAAEPGSPQVVAELLRHVEDVDVRAADGRTPLWEAACHGAGESVALLLDAGADAWTAQLGGRSPGRLALTTSLAPLFERLPGAVPLTEEECAVQREADDRAAVFRLGTPRGCRPPSSPASTRRRRYGAWRRPGRRTRTCS